MLAALTLALVACGEPRPVNPGANTLIFAGQELKRTDLGYGLSIAEMGRFDAVNERIYLRAPWSPAQGYAIHEYQHYIEWRLRNDHLAIIIVRDAFRDLMGPSFELGHNDLMRGLP